jgi:hypothetical protein
MTLRFLFAAFLAGCFLSPALADDKTADKPDYSDLSKIIQKTIAEKAPKKYEDRSEWGRTIQVPMNVRLPRLRRTVIQVGGRMEYPDGVWKRSYVWLDDPGKDIKIAVRDLKSTAAKTYRVKLDATVAFHGERERQRWRNGVKLFGIQVQADAEITAALDIEVKLAFDNKKFPPDVLVEPKVLDSKLLLDKFDLNRVGNVLVGDSARELGDELKEFIQGLLSQYDEDVKHAANDAIAKALKEGKGRFSAASLLKVTTSAKPKE